MSVVALRHAERQPRSIRPAMVGIRRWRTLATVSALAYPLAFYALLLAVLITEYGQLPNYLTPYNWIANVQRIIASTSSVTDIVSIVLDEWLIETGHINYDYGHGIADWSLSIVPHQLALMALAGALAGINVGLFLDQPAGGSTMQQFVRTSRFGLLTSAGLVCASMPNTMVFSVVHCATPSWVGGLAVLGFDSYNVFPLEPYGPLIWILGLAALSLSAVMLTRERAAARLPTMSAQKEPTPC